MCEFSESCCSDFTKYFPAGSFCAENDALSKVKNKIAWFSKKPRPSSAISHHPTERPVGDELCRRKSFEAGSSSHVSQEELRALRGCVSKRRVMFSSDQNSLTINSKCGKEGRGRLPLSSHPLHLAHDRFLSSSDNHLCQNRIEYDRFSSLSQSSIPDSVSVQFRYDSHECMSTLSSVGSHSERIEVLDCCNSTACNFVGTKNLRTAAQSNRIACGNRIPCDEQHSSFPKITSSPLLRVSHDQSYHNSWPRHRAHPNRLCQYTYEIDNIKVPQSPRHLCRQEPANIVPADLLTSNLKTSEPEVVGSKSSVCSTSCVSSSERPRLNYIKGVDGVDFKQKTDVSQCLLSASDI